jgi:hypothetical protein
MRIDLTGGQPRATSAHVGGSRLGLGGGEPYTLDRRGPVEALQRDAVLETCLHQVAFEGLLVAALDLIGQQQREERDVVELLCARHASVSRSGKMGSTGPSLRRLSKRTSRDRRSWLNLHG